nr:PRAME family member 12-like [Microcebus murinus]
MSLQAPPRLLQLAGQSLLRDEAVAIRDVKELPSDFFPQLFMEAFTKRQRKVLTAMVQAWPFTCLPLGSLMLTLDLETLRAVLDGLDVLLAQKVRPSGRKLQVLDLRDVDENFWSLWSVWSAAPVSPSRATSLRETEADCPCTGRQRPLKVVVDLRYSIEDGITREFLMYACDWAQQRKDLVHLCCKRLDLYVWNFDKVRKFLEMVDLNCIEDIEVHIYCHRDRLEQFVPYLIQMKSVRNIIFRNFLGRAGQAPEASTEGITFDGNHPPLDSRCHQLMTFNFCGNQISKAALENLLRHTLGLERLKSVTYPVPHECYHGDFEYIYWERFLQLRAWLMEILRDTQALRKPEVILFRTLPCSTCGSRASYDLEPSPCCCRRFGREP